MPPTFASLAAKFTGGTVTLPEVAAPRQPQSARTVSTPAAYDPLQTPKSSRGSSCSPRTVIKAREAHSDAPPFAPWVPPRKTISSRENAILFPPGPVFKKNNFRAQLAPLRLHNFLDSDHMMEELSDDFMSPLTITLKAVQEERVDNLRLIREHFLSFADKNQELDTTAFSKACQAIGIKNAELIDYLFNEFDEDGGGNLDADEVCEALRRFLDGPDKEKIWRQCFKLYDDDGSGEITYLELQLTRGGRTDATLGITQDQKDVMMHLFKTSKYLDANGSIDLDEFGLLMQYEPTLVKAMFSTIAAQLAKKLGINLDPNAGLNKAVKAIGAVAKMKKGPSSPKAQ
mmetsp:Transcript_114638/g.199373  ORF Transcript_114638/g.199373 Transcript_114638/m.199373 type:complete len:344 (-) Transcript_114638:173-1204(-)